MRQLAPSGTPITTKELSAWLTTLFSQEKVLQQFKEDLCHHFNVRHCCFLSTGRAAMALLLQSLAELKHSTKDTVIIPSYTCFSVPSSIIKAGLRIKICDIDPSTLDYDYHKLERTDFSKVLAVVSANLYGIPNNLSLLEKITQKKGVFFLDDAAQSMGASTGDGRFAGTFGDAGLFSLDKGKVITSMNGGIIVTNSDKIAVHVESKIKHLRSPSTARCASEMAKMFFFSIFLNPALYWIPGSLPFLNLGKTIFTTDYPIEKYNKLLGGIAHAQFKQLDATNQMRGKRADYYRKKLAETHILRHIHFNDKTHPIYLRFPILIKEKNLRSKIVQNLSKEKLGATKSYPSSIVDIEQLEYELTEQNNASGGKTVAGQIITLPTHSLVSKQDQDRIISLIMNTVQ
jgi:dTDP-4-amino-4,6-dideoxygalactose transaminase